MTKLKSVIEKIQVGRKDENLSATAQNHLGDLLDSIDPKKELRLVFHIIASHVVEQIEDPAEARKLARDAVIEFEKEIEYWIKNNNKKGVA